MLQIEREMKRMLNQFEKILIVHYELAHPNRDFPIISSLFHDKLLTIFKEKTSILERYRLLIEWCEKEDDEIYRSVKINFKELHDKIFRVYLRQYENKRFELMNGLKHKKSKNKAKYAKKIALLNDQIEDQKKHALQLQNAIRKFEGIHIENSINFIQFRKIINQLKIDLEKIKPLLNGPDIFPIKKTTSAPKINIIDINKKLALVNLDKNIKKYKEKLDQESMIKKFLRFFSPVRWKRWAAIKKYEDTVVNCSDMQVQYENAVKWNQENEIAKTNIDMLTSRFYRTCCFEFSQRHEQNSFEESTGLSHKIQTELDFSVETFNHSAESHHTQLEYLNRQLSQLYDEKKVLINKLNALIAEVDMLKDEGLGYPQNSMGKIQEKIQAIQYEIAQLDKRKIISEAKQVSSQIVSLPRTADSKEIEELKKETTKFHYNTDTKEVIQSAVGKVLEDTIKYGGKGNNFIFMGTAQAKEVVNQLGTDEQKNQFSQVEVDLEKNCLTRQKQVVNELISALKRSLEIGDLKNILSRWYVTFTRVKNKKQTPEDEIIYENEIKKTRSLVNKIHARKSEELEKFIAEVIKSALNASSYHESSCSKMDACEQLGLENTEMLVLVYGTASQIKRWNQTVLPMIKSNLKKREVSSHINVRVELR